MQSFFCRLWSGLGSRKKPGCNGLGSALTTNFRQLRLGPGKPETLNKLDDWFFSVHIPLIYIYEHLFYKYFVRRSVS